MDPGDIDLECAGLLDKEELEGRATVVFFIAEHQVLYGCILADYMSS